MRTLLILLFIALSAAYGQQTMTSVAVLPSDASDGTVLSNDELEVLTDKMRQAALKVLPSDAFVLLKQDVVIKRLGGFEQYIKECNESSCIVNLGKKAAVDYVAQASVGKLGNKLRLKIELYNVYTEGLVSMLSDEKTKNIDDLLAIVEKRVPAEVFGKIPGASADSKTSSNIVVPEPNDISTPEAEAMSIATIIAAMPATATPEPKKPSNASFWVAIGLDLAGAAMIGYAAYENVEANKAFDIYNVRGYESDYYENAWKDVESSRSKRNMFYVIGGVLLASGIGVHIWF